MQTLDRKISDRLKAIKENVFAAAAKSNRRGEDIQIMAVTKTVPPEVVNIAIENGITLLGENRVQEYLSKQGQYHASPEQIHFIGHLQTNKVQYIIEKVSMIESVSSLSLAQEIDKRAGLASKIMDVLIQVNIAQEASKSGFSPEEALAAVLHISNYKNIKIKGLMCIPPKENAAFYLDKMGELFCQMKTQKLGDASMNILSMGMSGDYEEAILHHSNIIRLGSAIFGQRNIGG